MRKNLKPVSRDSDVSFEHWLSLTTYPESRKGELRRVWNDISKIDDPEKRYNAVKSFMKDEHYPDFKHARAINSRHDAFKCYSGPYFKQIEEAVYQIYHFIKHVPVADRPSVISDRLHRVGAKYVATDYTAFESLFTRELMESVEFELYEYMLSEVDDGDRVVAILREFLLGENVCTFKRFDVRVPATRMSGEMCTSLGNGFSNLMFMLFLCDKIGAKCDGFVEGDDGIFSVFGPLPTSSMFSELGLVIKLEVHEDLSSAGFCGIIFDPVDRINITDPREVLATFGWASAKYCRSSRNMRLTLLRAKALSYAHQYPGCPIISALAQYGLRMSRSYNLQAYVKNNRNISEWERQQLLEALKYKANSLEKECGMATRLLVEKKYGISISEQLAIEGYLNSLNVLQPLDLTMLHPDLFPASWAVNFWGFCDWSSERADISPLMAPFNVNTLPLLPEIRQSFATGALG